jgi:hypothetical protein
MAQPKAPTRRAGLQGPGEINFHRGINTFQKNRMLLQDGESASLLNVNYDDFGILSFLYPFRVIKHLEGRVHSIYKDTDNLWVGHGTRFSHLTYPGLVTTEILAGLSGKRISMFATENWLYLTNGEIHKKIYKPTLAVSAWGFDAPLSAPTAAATALTGTPDGIYDCYYTYVAKYPDGTEYETDLSPMAQVVTSLKTIDWTFSGEVPDSQITHLRLYRDKTGMTGTLEDMRKAVESRAEDVEEQIGKLTGVTATIFKQVVTQVNNKKAVQNMSGDQTVIVGPFMVAEISGAARLFEDNVSDDDLVQAVPFLRERYRPIFGG